MEINPIFREQTELCRELLTGSICYTSRKKVQHNNHYNYADSSAISFGTLHSLTAKITGNAYLEDMHKTVKLAMAKYVSDFKENISISEKIVHDYYIAIRQFENNDNSHYLIRQEGSNFYQIYQNYYSLKDISWDYEDSLINATKYLDDNLIDPSFFHFDNLVLIDYEQVVTPSNANAFLFYFSLCNYFYNHNSCNCYFLSKDNILFKFNGYGELLTSVNPKEVPQQIGFF